MGLGATLGSLRGWLAYTLSTLPEPWVRWRMRRRTTLHGQAVHPRTAWFLHIASLDPGGSHAWPVAVQRAAWRALAVRASKPFPEVSAVDLVVPGPAGEIPVRVYRSPGANALPGLVYLHGGGWVIGDLEAGDGLCRRLAAEGGLVVVAVDYRLAPEHPWPAAAEDTLAAWRAVVCDPGRFGVQPGRIALGGDSAGGQLIAVACQTLRDAGEALPSLQLLIYPAVDMAQAAPSRARLGRGLFLTEAQITWFRDQWVQGRVALDDARLSPARGRLAGLPPALVVTAGLDPLHDEGVAYAEALRHAGVVAEVLDLPGQIHGFVNLGGLLPDADRDLTALCARLRARIAEPHLVEPQDLRHER